jgi:hypothetical protein
MLLHLHPCKVGLLHVGLEKKMTNAKRSRQVSLYQFVIQGLQYFYRISLLLAIHPTFFQHPLSHVEHFMLSNHKGYVQ